MIDKKRRTLLQGIGLTSSLGLSACATQPVAPSISKSPASSKKAQPHVVVIGGGFGGATAAKYLRKFAPQVKVTLIEYNKFYTTGPGSNWVLGGLRHVNSITFDYESLKSRYDINVIHDWASAIDADEKNVRLKSGERISYDRLIVSPGIDLKFDKIEGYSEKDTHRVPHAWKPGIQTVILRNQLQAMRDGGTVVIAPPENHFRCPPGPYERVSMIAHYLTRHKPKSKILILDSKATFSKQDRFEQGWKKFYGFGTEKSMIEFVAAPDGEVTKIDAKKLVAYSGATEERVQADILNIIPPQQAGTIAQAAHLTDESGWCPINVATSESKLVPFVHIIGDAANQTPMPKSGFSANSGAKVCAAAIAAIYNGTPIQNPHWANTCYSLISPDYGISTAQVYSLGENGSPTSTIDAGGVTPEDGDFAAEASFAESWWHNITQDIYG